MIGPLGTAASPQLRAAEAPAKPIDPAYVPADVGFVEVAHPKLIYSLPAAQIFPLEIVTAYGLKEWGIDLANVDEAIAFGRFPKSPKDEIIGGVLHFAQPPAVAEIKTKLLTHAKESKQIAGKAIYRMTENGTGVAYLPNDKTLLFASNPEFLEQMIAARATTNKPTALLQQFDSRTHLGAMFDVAGGRDAIHVALREAPALPEPLSELKKLPDLISWVKVEYKLTEHFNIDVAAEGNDEKSAAEAEQIIKNGLAIGQQLAVGFLSENAANSDDPVDQAIVKYGKRIYGKIIKELVPTRDGKQLSFNTKAFGDITVAFVAGMTLPTSTSAARESARRAQSANHLKQLTLGMFSSNTASGHFPARANFDKNGKPLLSWRVHLLPYLDEVALYKEFHLDEPWDSAHNKTLIAKMPRVFRNPNRDANDFTTTYLMPVGKGLIFDGDQGVRIELAKNGFPKPILLLEVNDENAVVWTKPDDLNVDLKNPLAGLGTAHHAGFTVVFANGEVILVTPGIDPQAFAAALTIAGGSTKPE